MKRIGSRIIWIALAIALIVLAGMRISQQSKSSIVPAGDGEAAQSVEVVDARRDTIEERSDLGGSIVPGSEVFVTSKIPGRVVRVLASVGQRVAAGDALVEIDSAEFAALRAALTQAEINLSDASLSFERFDNLYKQQAISKQQWESALNRLKLASAQYQAAKEQLAQAGGAAGGPNGERMVLTAPQAGTVASKSVDPGNLVSPGSPLFTIVDIRTVYARIGVPENAVNKVKPGAEVDVRIDSLGTTRKGKVDSVGPTPDARTRQYPVSIVMDNPNEDAKPGMFVHIELSLGKKDNVLVVPKDAIVERVGKQVVYVVKSGQPDRAEERVVTLGVMNGEMVEILSGVAEGEKVVTNGQHLLVDGVPVKIVEPAAKGGSEGGTKAQ